MMQNPPKNGPKSPQNREKSVKISFGGSFGAGSLPGRSDLFGLMLFWSLFGRKWSPQGSFLGPPEIQNATKIALLSIDRRLDPPKMVSGRGLEKT